MNTIATSPTITPDDLLRMPDEGKGFELDDGRLEELNVSRKSSRVAGQVYIRLENYCHANHPAWVFPEGTSYRCFPRHPNRVRRPDTSVIALGRMTVAEYDAVGHCPIVPDLAVEVLSPKDLVYRVNRKIAEWLTAGVRVLWVIDPDLRTVQIHRPDEPTILHLREPDTLTGDPVLPGFACPVADLFRLPAPPAPVSS